MRAVVGGRGQGGDHESVHSDDHGGLFAAARAGPVVGHRAGRRNHPGRRRLRHRHGAAVTGARVPACGRATAGQGRNRAHLDFATAPGITLAQQVQRLAGPGASAAREHSVPGPTRAVLQDPAGNEFRVHRTATAPAPEAVAHHRRHRRAPCRGPGEGAGKPACPRPWHRHSPAGGTSRHPHQAEETRAVATPADARARHHAPGGSCSS
ncbi:VOC family protein [Kitasatospora sp. NPDC001527]|uniref:VOC family protein n=1 Tax=Kitasatospora sp. NPDC001527 TaxID=3154519 RepID=UPI00332293F5